MTPTEIAGRGIRVTSVHPGPVTDLTRYIPLQLGKRRNR